MNSRTIVALITAVFVVAGAALALNLYSLPAPDRHVYGYGAPGHIPSYLKSRQCDDDPVGCSLVVW